MGLPKTEAEYAMLAEEVHFQPELTYFMQARISVSDDGRLMAHPIHGHGSGDLANLLECDAFIELPKGRSIYSQGEVFKVIWYR